VSVASIASALGEARREGGDRCPLPFPVDALCAALGLAGEGLACFPCRDDKGPATPHGFKDATCDPMALRNLWRQYPAPLVGVATGETSGLAVLDIDRKHAIAREWWAMNRCRLPATRTHRTLNGGLHLVFQHSPGLKCSVSKIARGVDVRGVGGYCVWWPAAGLPVLSDVPAALWPAWLLDQLIQKPSLSPSRATFSAMPLDDRKLAGLVRAVAGAAEGERNHVLFWASCRIGEAIRSGRIGEDFGTAVLEEAATRCGLPVTEARRTIASGLRAAVQ
jgi:hypothetical protein